MHISFQNQMNDIKVSPQYYNIPCTTNGTLRSNHLGSMCATEFIEPFSTFSPMKTLKNRTTLQNVFNPYELISSTLHNNEFSPSTSLFGLIGTNRLKKDESIGKASLRKRNDDNRFDVLDILPNKTNESSLKQSGRTPSSGLVSFTNSESFPISIRSSTNPTWESRTSKYYLVLHKW